jgi:hypothetical protein
MRKHRLIRLIKDRGCVITGVLLPKNTLVYANHLVDDVWSITLGKDNSIALSVINYEHFDFVE